MDSSTAITSGYVKVSNFTKGTNLTVSIQSTGEYTADLANLSSGWDSSDIIYLKAYTLNKIGEARLKIAATDTLWDADIYLREGKERDEVTYVLHAASVQVGSTARTINFIEVNTDVQKLSITAAANTPINHQFPAGIRFSGGIRIIRAASGTNKNTTSAGTALGDLNNDSKNIVVSLSGYPNG